MTATFKRIIIAAIALIAIAGLSSALVLSGGCSANTAGPAEGAKVDAINFMLDTSGIKERIDSEVRKKATEVAERYGVSATAVNNIMDSVAITDWKATTLPADAIETGAYDVQTDDLSATITTYEDPGIVTVDAYGQSITMEVPESAQGYVPMLRYLQALK